MLGFLLADTNPKAAGDFLPLAASCLTPLQGSQIHTLAFPRLTHTQTYTDEHMMDYKYPGQDGVCVQHSAHRGTHQPRLGPAAELSVSTFQLG